MRHCGGRERLFPSSIFGRIKARMRATHFLMKTLPRVSSEMALHVLAYNVTRVMNIIGVQPLLAAIGTLVVIALAPMPTSQQLGPNRFCTTKTKNRFQRLVRCGDLVAAIQVKASQFAEVVSEMFGEVHASGRSKRCIAWSLDPQHLGCSALRLSDTTTSREGATHATPSTLQ